MQDERDSFVLVPNVRRSELLVAGGKGAAYVLALPLAHVHHAISYPRITAALEPADRWWFADVPRKWLDGAVALLEAA